MRLFIKLRKCTHVHTRARAHVKATEDFHIWHISDEIRIKKSRRFLNVTLRTRTIFFIDAAKCKLLANFTDWFGRQIGQTWQTCHAYSFPNLVKLDRRTLQTELVDQLDISYLMYCLVGNFTEEKIEE